MKKIKEITDYDNHDTVNYINKNNPLRLSDINIELPEEPPVKVINLRLPTEMLNRLQALASQNDISYIALIKTLLQEGLDKRIPAR